MKHKMDSIRRHRPTVALVLAGGGAKGAAHVGALEYIEELGIPIDMVLGTSMGGLVGGLVAMGYSSKEIDTILTTTNWGVMLSDQVPVNKMSYMRRKYNETYFIRSPFRYESEEWERRQREDYITRKANETANPLTSSEMGQAYTANLISNLPDGDGLQRPAHPLLLRGHRPGHDESQILDPRPPVRRHARHHVHPLLLHARP